MTKSSDYRLGATLISPTGIPVWTITPGTTSGKVLLRYKTSDTTVTLGQEGVAMFISALRAAKKEAKENHEAHLEQERKKKEEAEAALAAAEEIRLAERAKKEALDD